MRTAIAVTAALGLTLAAAAATPRPVAADTAVKIHLHFDLQPVVQQISKMQPEAASRFTDHDVAMEIQGERARVNLADGQGAMLIDLAKGTVTMLDANQRRYQTVSIAELRGNTRQHPPNMHPPSAKEEARLKEFHIATSFAPTGKTDTVVGIPVTENLAEITVTRTPPTGGAPLPFAHVDLHFWTAAAGASMMSPQLAEMQRFTAIASQVFGLQGDLAQVAARLPGAGAQLAPFFQQLQANLNDKVTLKSDVDVLSPVLEKMAAAAAALKGLPSDDNTDPNAPLAQVSSTVTDLSAASFPASDFTVPAGYTLAPKHKDARHLGPRHDKGE